MSGLKHGAIGTSSKAYPIFSRIRNLREVDNMLSSLRRFSESEIAEQRLKIIKFYDRFGEKATYEAFGARRGTIHVWKKRLKQSGGRIGALVPLATRPRIVRRMNTNPLIVSFIKDLRMRYPRLGKEKIKPLFGSVLLRE